MNIKLNEPIPVKFIITTKGGTRVYSSGEILVTKTRIEFLKSPFALKDDIKAMAGSRWHGYDDPPRKIWTVENSPGNWFALQVMLGGNPYEWFDRPLENYEYDRPLMEHQKDMSDAGLTYHYQIWGAEMGVGKSLSAIEVMEKSGVTRWFWVGPRSALMAVEREFKKWAVSDDIDMEVMTYEALTKKMKNWKDGDIPPQGVIFDESSRLKTPTSQRSQAAQALTDGIRAEYGTAGYVILMSGTPAPRSPMDWWKPSMICYPGYLREGNVNAFRTRMGVCTKQENSITGQTFLQHVTWRDDESKCDICGGYDPSVSREDDVLYCEEDGHKFTKSKNEVAYLYDRLKGLAIIKHKKDCLDLPDKRYRIIRCEVTPALKRVAKTLLKAAPSTITGLTWLRELSDGFQYRTKEVGIQECSVCEGTGTTEYWLDPDDSEKAFTMTEMLDPEYVDTLRKTQLACMACTGSGEVPKYERTVKTIPCPKDEALIELLDENEEQGRVVIFAGFTGSIDKLVDLCKREKWAVVRVDGRGWITYDAEGNRIDVKPLDYWADLESNPRVAFVAHPKSGGFGLTLTEARMAIYYSNSWESESRSQSEDRIHRLGLDENLGATIVDLIHLPTDEAVLERLKQNRRLELMTMGDVESTLTEE